MPAFVPHADPSAREALAEIEKHTGPSNFFRAMSQRPQAMSEFSRLYQTIMGTGTLERRLKEMVYLAVSTVNECDYCTAHHSQTALQAGLSNPEIDALAAETDQDFSPRERVALQYARELTRTAALADSDMRNTLETQFNPEQLVELTLIISLANFTNRFNNGLAVPLEKESHRAAS